MKLLAITVVGGIILIAAVRPATPADREARAEPFRISDVEVSTRAPPDPGGSGAALGAKGEWANERWLVINVTFATEPDWVDEVELKYYVLVLAGHEPKLLTGDQRLVSLKKGRRHYTAVFIPPSTLERFGGDTPKAIAVQLFHRGQRVATFTDAEKLPHWWERYTPLTGYLLKPSETPWATVAYQRYEAARAGD